ncbi:hypothetical protein B0T17DRAFT_535477 [Bombardia bombarda]|uniref:F-box domain-containing protein n=1 Tax=Bombardia bombarda TaxID=252184 RepID=A0AA39WUS8_9PEZI|nr:hypothetical protein B0T17DRAFT_535477 [Bombardia bombarda]
MSADHLSALHCRGPAWDIVLQNLSLSSLKNLRLTSKTLAAACNHHRFLRFIENQTTDLSTQSLQSLATLAAHPLGRGVKHLTLLAAVYDKSWLERIVQTKLIPQNSSSGMIQLTTSSVATEEQISQYINELEWLKEKKKELEEASDDSITDSLVAILQKFEVLNCLKLEATVILRQGRKQGSTTTNFRDWRMGWEHAARTFRITMRALVRSKATVEKLTVLRDTKRCGVAPRHIAAQVQGLQAGDLKGIKEFALCIGIGSVAEENEHHAAAADLIGAMPNLEALDVQFFMAHRIDSERELSESIFGSIASEAHLPCLQRCRLRGVRTRQDTLVELITSRPNIRDLELDELDLHDSPDVGEVLQALIKSLPSLTRARLSNLWGAKGLMNLNPRGGSRALEENRKGWSVRCTVGGDMVHTIVLEGDELKADIKFRPAPGGRMLGSLRQHKWRALREAEYAIYTS